GTDVKVLADSSPQHCRRHVAPAALLLCLVQDVQHDALLARETVPHVGNDVLDAVHRVRVCDFLAGFTEAGTQPCATRERRAGFACRQPTRSSAEEPPIRLSATSRRVTLFATDAASASKFSPSSVADFAVQTSWFVSVS